MAKKDRTGKRAKRDMLKRRIPDLGYYIIVTDTQATEANYLIGLRDALPHELRDRIVIKVSQTNTKDLVEYCKTQAVLEPQYGEPWIVFDRDKVTLFDEIIWKAKKGGIQVGWSNPCIEIWFDAYFGQMRSYSDSKACIRRFSQAYEKRVGSEYDKADKKIYETLNRFGDENKAISLAEMRLKAYKDSAIKKPSDMCPATTLHHLVDEIRKKTNAK